MQTKSAGISDNNIFKKQDKEKKKRKKNDCNARRKRRKLPGWKNKRKTRTSTCPLYAEKSHPTPLSSQHNTC
jgi:hypothetical protein